MYRALGSTATARLSDGNLVGNIPFIAAVVNGLHLAGGSGAVRFKDEDTGVTYSFTHGQTISIP